MKTAIIIHGSLGNPDNHWYQWLKGELEKQRFEVLAPQFPIEEGEQTVANWLKVLEPMREKMEGGIVVGHSLGAPFIVDLFNEWDVKLKGAFFVGGFIGPHGAEGVTFEDFSERDYDWEKIKNSCEHFIVLNSDNDPYVPIEKGKLLAEKLGVELTVVPSAGHFQAQSGYETFPFLLKKQNNCTWKVLVVRRYKDFAWREELCQRVLRFRRGQYLSAWKIWGRIGSIYVNYCSYIEVAVL